MPWKQKFVGMNPPCQETPDQSSWQEGTQQLQRPAIDCALPKTLKITLKITVFPSSCDIYSLTYFILDCQVICPKIQRVSKGLPAAVLGLPNWDLFGSPSPHSCSSLHGIIWVRKDLQNHHIQDLQNHHVQPSAWPTKSHHYTTSLGATSTHLPNTSRGGDATVLLTQSYRHPS